MGELARGVYPVAFGTEVPFGELNLLSFLGLGKWTPVPKGFAKVAPGTRAARPREHGTWLPRDTKDETLDWREAWFNFG